VNEREPATVAGGAELESVAAVVVGAGPAGLAVSRELGRRGVEHLVLEAGAIGSSWEGFYRSLVLHTGKHLSHLPGRRFPRDMPLFPPRERFLAYLRDYAAHFQLPVREATRVLSAERGPEGWTLETSGGRIRSRALVVATGIATNPTRPNLAGEDDFGGEILHSAEYVEPSRFAGRRVLVVGVGNSGGEIAGELAGAGVATTVCVRSGAHLMPLRMLGVPSQYWGAVIGLLPAPLPEKISRGATALRHALTGPPLIPRSNRPILARPPLLGDSLPAALRSGRVSLRGALDRLLPGAARFQDGTEEPFDTIILATGYRPALGFLGALATLDAEGFPIRSGVRSLDHSDLFFVGHRYGHSGALTAIRHDARRAAREVAQHIESFDGSQTVGSMANGPTIDHPGGRPPERPASP
jgi:thioredoxin reductase